MIDKLAKPNDKAPKSMASAQVHINCAMWKKLICHQHYSVRNGKSELERFMNKMERRQRHVQHQSDTQE